jgi:hypothetical protein
MSVRGGVIDRAGKGATSLVRTDYARNDNEDRLMLQIIE